MPDGKDLWVRLLKFLERELIIQQQKQVINFNDETKQTLRSIQGGKVSGSYLTNQHQESQISTIFVVQLIMSIRKWPE